MDDYDEIINLEVPRSVIEQLAQDPAAQKSLIDLDIDPEDNEHLVDIFDPDNGGTITVTDFIEGLRRLRGDPRRSDIISIDLMLRSVQTSVNEILARSESRSM